MLKKILLFSSLIVFIPVIIVSIFIRNDVITFNFSNNTIVRVYRQKTGDIDKVPIEEYIIGVVAGEMPISFDLEALKAQSVASRSYVMKQIEKNINKEYDVVDTVINQVYLDKEYLMNIWGNLYFDNINKIKEAVLYTKGEYLSYDGNVVEALFFSTSPGITENSEEIFTSKEPYLRSVVSTWDNISPVYNTKKVYSLSEFYDLLGLEYNEKLNIYITEKTSTGRIKKIKINEKEMDASYIVSCLSLRSTFFEIVREGNKVTVINKGYGHGVGMSQYGAEAMARQGYLYDDILKYYYQNIEIKNFKN